MCTLPGIARTHTPRQKKKKFFGIEMLVGELLLQSAVCMVLEMMRIYIEIYNMYLLHIHVNTYVIQIQKEKQIQKKRELKKGRKTKTQYYRICVD